MKRILITGAGGFIGGRLVEILKETINPEINILLRNIAKAARISRYPIHYFKGNTVDEESVKAAMKDCDVVVHCAHDFGNPEGNLRAADSIAKQCLQNKVSRLIYISSFAVHRTDSGEIINEKSALNRQWEYAVNKIAIEKKLIEYHEQSSLPVVILRPTVVYGPFSAAWTINTFLQLQQSRLVVPYQGKRICNAVYIDDVVYSILQAIDSPGTCNGKAYIVSGPDAVTWKTYYQSFLSYPGLQEPVYISDADSENLYKKLNIGQPENTRPSLIKDPITFLKKTPVYGFYKGLLKNPFFRKKLLSVKSAIPRPLVYPDKEAFDTVSCIGKVDISKLKTELGFFPKVSFADGMKNNMAWMQWANLNCNG